MELLLHNKELEGALHEIAEVVRNAGGRVLAVGGCVRDSLLDQRAEELDLEAYGLSPADLRSALSSRFDVDLVGEAFGVLKLRSLPIDVSLPRRESKTGSGHKGFEIQSDPSLDVREASERRDFTINSMAFDPLTGELIDHWGGCADLEKRILRHVSNKFSEDPLRVLRGMQFAARFELTPAGDTVALCRGIGAESLARERIFDEWKKLLLKGTKPSIGLGFLKDTGWLSYYPELETLVDCPQDRHWHPEGDVWVHTLLCMDAFATERIGNDSEDLIVGLAVLCHDFGKPLTTAELDGRIRSIGHCEAGAEPTRSFLGRMTNQSDLVEAIVPLVVEHFRPQDLYEADSSDAAVRRLAHRVDRIDRLTRVAKADQLGRGPGSKTEFPAIEWLLAKAHELEVRDSAPQPIVMGRHLLELGLEPGPVFRPILDQCYEAQLDGKISSVDEGIAFANELLKQSD